MSKHTDNETGYVVVTVRWDIPVAWFETYADASAWLWTVSNMAGYTIVSAADYKDEGNEA